MNSPISCVFLGEESTISIITMKVETICNESQLEEGQYKKAISDYMKDEKKGDVGSGDSSRRSDNSRKDEDDDDKNFIYTPEEKKLLRKINLTTIPFIFAIVFLQVGNRII